MATTTHYAAIDATNITGAIYGIGTTREAALAEALKPGDPCVTHEGDDLGPDHGPADHFEIVPCSPEAAAYIEQRGGASSPDLTVTSRDGVCLRSEEK